MNGSTTEHTSLLDANWDLTRFDTEYNEYMKRLWQLGNIFSLLIALGVNFLIGAQLVGLPAINDISDKYATYLTPAGYAFAIWSLIYVLLIVFAVYQARDIITPRKENTLPGEIGPFFIIASIANGLWTYVFVNELVGLSVLILLILTGSLYLLLWRLKIATDSPPLKVIACVWWPLLVYTGWVTVASVVNIASWVASLGVVITPLAASIVLVLLGAILLALLVKRNVRELLLACSWGIVGIAVQQLHTTDGQLVSTTAFGVAAVLLVSVMIHGYMNRHENPMLHRNKRS